MTNVFLLAVVASAILFTAPRGGFAALSCDVTFHAQAAEPYGAMLWDADYRSAPGDLLGSAENVKCRPLVSGLRFAIDIDSERLLRQALIRIEGFQGDISACTFRARTTPVPADFVITILDAVTIFGEPIVEPNVTVKLSCEPAVTVCGDGIVDTDDGEDCDEGPYVEGSCCSSSCTFEPPGTACGPNAGETCHVPDTCDGLGACLTTLAHFESEESCALRQDGAGPLDVQQFGAATALSDDYLVVGAPAADGGPGTVHVFSKSNEHYVEIEQSSPIAVPFQSAAGTAFGTSVDVDGDTIVVGAPGDVAGQLHGSVSVFVRKQETWALQATLRPPSGSCRAFGTDVGVSGNTIVVGAPDGNCAFAFERSGSTWSAPKALTGNSGPDERFGQAVDVAGDRIVIGAPGSAVDEPDGATGSACGSPGSAYFYRRSGGVWIGEGKTPERSDSFRADACFGMSVGIGGLSAAVGAPNDGSTGLGAGAAYVVELLDGKWTLTEQLTAFPERQENEQFGSSIDMKPDVIIVGAPGVASYVFDNAPDVEASFAHRAAGKFGKWVGRRVIRRPADNSGKLSKFGFAVAVAPARAIVGAPGTELQGFEREGAVYPTDAAVGPVDPCGNSVVGAGETCDDGDDVWAPGELCNASCDLVVCGDPNDSGTVTSIDALFTLRAAVQLNACDMGICDVNGNGSVTAIDALLVLGRAVGLDVLLSCSTS